LRGSVLNNRRLRDYPRLFLISGVLVLFINVLLHQGWIGGLTGIMMSGDFISNYAGGIQYRTGIDQLYNPYVQEEIQAELIAPTVSAGFAPFISMPNVAWAYSLLTALPLAWAVFGWLLFSLCCMTTAVYLMQRWLVPLWLKRKGLSALQLAVIVCSSFAFIIGLQAGQTHTLTLLLVAGVVITSRNEKWVLSGVLAGLLIYKPQFALGFLILWLVWKRWDALVSFSIIAGLWVVIPLLQHGIEPFQAYLEFSDMLFLLPYAKESFPISIMATPYALLATLIPFQAVHYVQYLFIIGATVLTFALGAFAFRQRHLPAYERNASLVLAIFYPLLTLPHALLYDLLILVPAILLMAEHQQQAESLLRPVIATYIGLLFLPLVGIVFRAALTALIPIGLFLKQINSLWHFDRGSIAPPIDISN
jgi:alpha-1,2-mannosyltransferase